MIYLWIILALTSFLSLVYGLSLVLGFGWAMFIIELLGQSVTTDYYHAQRDFPATKNVDKKQAGLWHIIIGIVTGMIAISML